MKALKKRPVLRTCLGCGERKSQATLIRLVRSPEGTLYVDLEGKLPGRGAYVCPQQQCVERALHEKKLSKAFRRPTQSPHPTQFLDHLVARKREKIASFLGLAQKAGQVVSGHARLTQALAAGEIFFLLLAEDISPERQGEYEQLCHLHQTVSCMLFTKEKLGTLIGREVRSAVGIKDAQFAKVLATYFPLLLPEREAPAGP